MNIQRLRDRLRVFDIETAARLEGEIETAIRRARVSGILADRIADRIIADAREQADDSAEHDNEADGLKRCTDCGGSGWVTLFTGRQHCPTCDGSGWT